MNAPETHITESINAAHAVLMKAAEAMSAEQVAKSIGRALAEAKKQLKELSGLGMIEMEPRAGGLPFYRLTVASRTSVCESVQTAVVEQTDSPSAEREPERVLTPEAEAERGDFEAAYGIDGNCACHLSAPCGSCTHPGNPRNQEEDESCWMTAGDSEGGETDAPAEMQATSAEMQASSDEMQVTSCAPIDWTAPEMQYLAPEDYELPPADPVMLAMANRALGEQLKAMELDRNDLRTRLDDVQLRWQADVDLLTGRNHRLHEELEAVRGELATCRSAENVALKTLNDAMPGFGAEHQAQQQISSLTTDVVNTRRALTDAINEANRLRNELALERQAREALQEQMNAVDVKDFAVGYLVRTAKRKPRYLTKPDRAQAAALAAVRSGAAKADVLAVVPMGSAKRGAEWRAAA